MSCETGTLTDDWDFIPPKTIKDPKAKKPPDWVDAAKMDDPEDYKPEDWKKPEQIADPDATKPEDWDDKMDGEWEPPMIDSPKYLEVAARVMVKIMKTEKKTFPLMLDKQRPVRKDVNYKSDGTPMCTPMTTAFFKFKCTPRGTPSSKSDGTPMCTPMTIAFSKSKGTPMGPPNSKRLLAPNKVFFKMNYQSFRDYPEPSVCFSKIVV